MESAVRALIPPCFRPARPDDGTALRWREATVQGRTAWYGDGGEGPVVLFLHGWGLGSRAYKRALRRLTARGRRVLAPAMPGFGGTEGLRGEVSIQAYARWVAAFLDAVGIDEPVVVVGHSFGGGVAVKLAHDHPSRVGYLALLNAVGGGSWLQTPGEVRHLSERPLVDWARHFAVEFFPVVQGVEMLDAMREDLLRNLVQNPLALVRAAHLARSADLTPELFELHLRGTPVLALTSAGDGVIPESAFTALCDAIGIEGKVVAGPHSWLLSDPDAFDAVLDNVLDVDAAATAAPEKTTRAEIARLLTATRMPRDVVRSVLVEASPLWLSSAPPATLAADLALCHPRLAAGEVRAVVRSLDADADRLTVVAGDRPGLLADTAAAVADAGLSIRSASAVTWRTTGVAMHALTIERPGRRTPDWEALGERLRSIGTAESWPPVSPVGDVRVEVNGDALGRALVVVDAPDQLGLLWSIAAALAAQGVGIESASVTTGPDGLAHDVFLVEGDVDPDDLVDRLGGPVARAG